MISSPKGFKSLKNIKIYNSLSKAQGVCRQPFSLFLACILLSAGITACGGPIQFTAAQLAKKCDLSGSVPKRSESLNARVYIDGTPSMSGYVASSSSEYVATLKQLQQAFSTAWPIADVNYFRFGEEVFPMNSATQPDPRLSGFYQGGAGLGNSTMDLAIADALSAQSKTKGKSHLTIIVTDLYQKKADIDPILESLNQKILGKDLTVGIFGVKSLFNGTVYDIGVANRTVKFSGEHPFYLLILGEYGDVDHLIEQLNKDPAIKSASEATIFTSKPILPLAAFLPQAHPPDLKQLSRLASRPQTINNGKVMVRGLLKDENKIESLKITSRKDIDITYPITYQFLNHVLGVDKVSQNTQVFTFASKEFQASDLQTAISIQPPDQWLTRSTSNTVNLGMKINVKDLKSGVHLFVTDLQASDLKSPKWWSDWSINEESSDGSRTHNLSSFLGGLKTVIEQKKPPIARLCYVVQK